MYQLPLGLGIEKLMEDEEVRRTAFSAQSVINQKKNHYPALGFHTL